MTIEMMMSRSCAMESSQQAQMNIHPHAMTLAKIQWAPWASDDRNVRNNNGIRIYSPSLFILNFQMIKFLAGYQHLLTNIEAYIKKMN